MRLIGNFGFLTDRESATSRTHNVRQYSLAVSSAVRAIAYILAFMPGSVDCMACDDAGASSAYTLQVRAGNKQRAAC